MTESRHLYRSDDAVIAGVCAGIAEYFGIDATLVRVIAVILLVLGAGSPIIIYLVLMIVIPRKPDDWSAPLDVEPVGADEPPSTSCGPKPPAGAPVCSCAAPASGVAVPAAPASAAPGTSSPVAPAAAASAAPGTSSPVAPFAPGPDMSGAQADGNVPFSGTSQPGAPAPSSAVNPGAAYSAAYSTVRDAQTPASGEKGGSFWPLVIVGALLICLGVGAFINRLDPGFPLWGLWPLSVVLCGVIVALTKDGGGHRSVRICDGIALAALGLVLLCCTLSTDADPWALLHMCLALWPLLVIAAGLSLIGRNLDSRGFHCAAAGLVVLTLIGGTASFASLDGVYPLQGVYAGQNGTAIVSKDRGITVQQGDDGALDIRLGATEALLGATPGSDVMLSSGSTYDLDLQVGASKADVDLSDVSVASCDIDAGMSQVAISLGAPCEGGSTLTVSGGASSVSLSVDPDEPVLIMIDGISSNDVESSKVYLYDESAGGWVTPAYENAVAQGRPCWVCHISGALLDVSMDIR